MNSEGEPALTVVEIAELLGLSARTIRAALAGIEPDGSRTVNGQVCRTWSYSRLPAMTRAALPPKEALREAIGARGL